MATMTTTLDTLYETRDELATDIATAGPGRQGTAWMADRVKAWEAVGEQIRTLEDAEAEAQDEDGYEEEEEEDVEEETTTEQREARYQALVDVAGDWTSGPDQYAVEAVAALIGEGQGAAVLEALRAAGLI